MKQKLLLALSAVAMAFIIQPRAEALSFTTFTDRSAFEAAVGAGSLTGQDFNRYTRDFTLTNSTNVIGDLAIAGNGNRTYIDVPAFRNVNKSKTIDGSAMLTVFASGADSSSLSFSSGITSFGADFADFSENRDTRFRFNDGTTLAPVLTGANGSGFFGFIADSQISSFGFQAFGIDDGIGIDNIVYSAFSEEEATPVPTPAPLLGVIGMGIAAIRKRKQTATAS